jgi:hypothetical protein
MPLETQATFLSSALSLTPARRSAIACAFVWLIAAQPSGTVLAQRANQANPDSDWPCRQILVEKISLPAIWSGPSIEGAKWRGDAAMADRVAQLAARRMPIETAERVIENFAKSSGPDKETQLIALFAGLFETLNRERTLVIEGLRRFGRKQKELAAKIRSENAEIQANAGTSNDDAGSETSPSRQNLEWDLRVFDERRLSLTYACETPTLIEQRLFALARTIQQNLD